MKRRPREKQKAKQFTISEARSESLDVDWRDSICQCNRALIATTNGSVAEDAGIGYESNVTTCRFRALLAQRGPGVKWGPCCSGQ